MRWHLLEDLIGWISLLVLSVVLMFVDLPVLDPLLSICISLFILRGVVKVLKPVIMILLQAVPDHEVAGKVPLLLGEIEHVIGYHDFHLWSLDGIDHVLTIHLVVSKEASLEGLAQIKKQFHSKLSQYGNIHSTIEIEFEGDSCDSVDCTLVT